MKQDFFTRTHSPSVTGSEGAGQKSLGTARVPETFLRTFIWSRVVFNSNMKTRGGFFSEALPMLWTLWGAKQIVAIWGA